MNKHCGGITPTQTLPHQGGGLKSAALRFCWFALAAILALASPAAAADLNIAFIGDLTGVHAFMAQDQLDGFRLGVKHLGGRLGGNEFNLTVIDDRHDLRTAQQAAEHLMQNEKVRVFLVSADAATESALVPVAAGGKSFVIALNAPAANTAGKECSPYFFSMAGLADTMNELAGQYLQLQGYRNLVIAGADTADEHAAAAAFRRGFKGQVTEVLSRHGEMDFEADFVKIHQAAPEAVYLLHTGGMAVNFIRQFSGSREREQMPLFGPGSTIDRSVLEASGPAALDIFSVGPWSEDMDFPANRRLITDFEGDYGRPVSYYAALGYDAAMLLDAALKSVDKRINDDEALRGALRRVDFPSTRGFFRFDTNHFPIQTYLVREVVQDARDRLVNEQRGLLMRDVRDGHAGECPMRWVAEPLPPPKG